MGEYDAASDDISLWGQIEKSRPKTVFLSRVILFADEVNLATEVQVNGNISFNELSVHPETVILGATTPPGTISFGWE